MSTEQEKQQAEKLANPWRNPPLAWCHQHQSHPSDCFYIHNPNAVVNEQREKETVDE